MAHSACIYTMGSVPSTPTVSAFVFITYSWHPTRTGSAAPGFGKKEQAVDEQVSLTHLHGSTRKNKRERVGIAKGKKKKKPGREEWRVPLDAVCNAAGRLPALVPQSSRHASPADSALWKKEREGRNFSNVSDTRGTEIAGLSPRIFEPCSHTRDFSGAPQRGIRDAHMITLFRTAYVCTKILPLRLSENSSAQLYPTNQKCQPFPSQG